MAAPLDGGFEFGVQVHKGAQALVGQPLQGDLFLSPAGRRSSMPRSVKYTLEELPRSTIWWRSASPNGSDGVAGDVGNSADATETVEAAHPPRPNRGSRCDVGCPVGA